MLKKSVHITFLSYIRLELDISPILKVLTLKNTKFLRVLYSQRPYGHQLNVNCRPYTFHGHTAKNWTIKNEGIHFTAIWPSNEHVKEWMLIARPYFLFYSFWPCTYYLNLNYLYCLKLRPYGRHLTILTKLFFINNSIKQKVKS